MKSLNKIDTDVVMFEIIAEGAMDKESIQQVMFKKLLSMQGYSSIPTVAIMEHELDNFHHLDPVKEFVSNNNLDYKQISSNGGEFRKYAIRAMTETLDYSEDEARDFLKSAIEKYNTLSPEAFAEECVKYVEKSNKENKRLTFIIDEIGQYVTSKRESDDRILELQGVVEKFASKGKGKIRLVVTAQEKLDQLIANSSFDKRKLGKLTDRFEVRFDLTSENVDEVARERMLKKKMETKDLFAKTYEKYQGNINTISNTEGNYKRVNSKETFMTYYPFLSYQFQLLPDLVQETTGSIYFQATERKFIFLVDTVLKKLKDKEFGRIVSTSDLFDALGASFFGSGIVNFVNSVDEFYSSEKIKASDIMKTLYMLKDLKSVTATETVISRMISKNIFERQYAILNEVKQAIDFLQKKKYITKYNGEINLVTDLEREFIREMDECIVDQPEIDRVITEQLKDIFNRKEIQYEEGPSIPIEWIFNNNGICGKKGGLQVKISRFEYENTEGIEFESMNHPETIYLVPNKENQINEMAKEIKQLDTTINSFRTKKSSKDSKDLLAKYHKILEEKKKDLNKQIREAFDNGKLIYEGDTIEPNKFLNDVTQLFKERVIPGNYTEITKTKASFKDIKEVLTAPQNKLSEIMTDEDHRVFDENGELLETHKIIDPVISYLNEDRLGADILEEFSKPPYGWARETILFSIAALIRGGKISINRIDSYSNHEIRNLLDNVGAFKNARVQRSVVISPEKRKNLMNLINSLLEDKKLNLQSPPSEFMKNAQEGMETLKRSLSGLRDKLSNLGIGIDLEIETLNPIINNLRAKTENCLDEVLEKKETIKELKATEEKISDFVDKKYDIINNQKQFINEINGEISKGAFDNSQKEELNNIIKKYNDTLPNIKSFGNELDGIFEKLKNTYKSYFKPIHDERDQKLKEINNYLEEIKDKTNELGKKASEQEWFIRKNEPCEKPEIDYSIKCKNCHSGYYETKLELDSLKSYFDNLKTKFNEFMKEKQKTETVGKTTNYSPKKITLKKKQPYSELKQTIENFEFSDDQEIEIELEE
jgi:hypothetical protein